MHDALVAPPALSDQREAEMPWRSWPISATAMDSGAMDSASEREYESDCESDSSMPGLVSSNSESPSDSSGDEPEPEPELPEPELLDPKPEPEPELLDPEPQPELALAERVRGGNEAGAGTTTQLLANSWGAGLPSFWCAELAASTNQRQYLVREEHAAQFTEEFPDYAGGNILSLGRTVEKATLDAKLVSYEPPVGAIRNTQARRPQRFVNERAIARPSYRVQHFPALLMVHAGGPVVMGATVLAIVTDGD